MEAGGGWQQVHLFVPHNNGGDLSQLEETHLQQLIFSPSSPRNTISHTAPFSLSLVRLQILRVVAKCAVSRRRPPHQSLLISPNMGNKFFVS